MIIAATSEIVAPLVLGAFLAIVFWPVADWLADRGLSRTMASVVVLVGLAAAIFGVSWFTGVAFVDQADDLTANLDKAIADIKGWFENTPVNQELVDQVRATTADVGPSLTSGVAGGVVSFLDSAFGFIAGAILGTIVFYYLLKDGSDLFRRRLERGQDPERVRSIGELANAR